MAVVVFYEKPGCSGNARQKALLEASGHTVVARNILTTSWTSMHLLSFLKLLPVPQWFNRNAPMVKRGAVNPDGFGELDAPAILGLFQANPILIRRPLLEVEGACRAGFELTAINDWIGLSAAFVDSSAVDNPEACLHPVDRDGRCSGHEGQCCHEPSRALET